MAEEGERGDFERLIQVLFDFQEFISAIRE